MNRVLYSLPHLTLFDCTPDQAVDAASQAGYDAISLRLLPASPLEQVPPFLGSGAYRKRIISRIKSAGLGVCDVELVRLKPQMEARDYEPFLEAAAELGAQFIIVAGDDPELERISANFSIFCEMAKTFGLMVRLEPMPWTFVPNLRTALKIIESTQQDNAGILLDPLHLHRASDGFEKIQDISSEQIGMIQLCDARKIFDPSLPALVKTARGDRLIPGQGDLDLELFLSYLPSVHTISIEVPNRRRAEHYSHIEWASMALNATKSLVSKVWAKRESS